MTSRRRFLTQSIGALAGAYWLQLQAFAQSSYAFFDLHTHPGMFLAKGAADGIDTAEALKGKGFTEEEVKKIAGGNAMRVLNKILKK